MKYTGGWLLLVACTLLAGCAGTDGESRARGEGGEPDDTAESAPDLTTAAGISPASEPSVMAGMMTYLADAPSFVDCDSGDRYPIAKEGGYLALERAYLDQVTAAGEPLRVSVLGRIESRPGMEGGVLPTLVVIEFQGDSPGAACGSEEMDQPLERTEWELTEIMNAPPVPPGTGAGLLLGDEGQLSGHTGCNAFTGTYELAGGRLTLALGAMTRMACLGPIATVERDYMEALRLTGGFRVTGSVLELMGPSGPVARFRSGTPQ